MAARLLMVIVLVLAVGVANAAPPEGWVCADTDWGDPDGYCDCGCGVTDTDCQNESALSCDYESCAVGTSPSYIDNSVCIELGADPELPEGWVCVSFWFSDGGCDCGCGGLDDDCSTATVESCVANQCPSGQFPGAVDNTTCYTPGEDPQLPTGWICDSAFYNDVNSLCDCGCGAQDVDCPDFNPDSCARDNCGDTQALSPTNNAICLSTDTDTSDTSSVDSDPVDTDSGVDTENGTDRQIIDRKLPDGTSDPGTDPDGDAAVTSSSGCSISCSVTSPTLFTLFF